MGITRGHLGVTVGYEGRQQQILDLFNGPELSDIFTYEGFTGTLDNKMYTWRTKGAGNRKITWRHNNDIFYIYALDDVTPKNSHVTQYNINWYFNYAINYTIVKNANSGALIMTVSNDKSWGIIWTNNKEEFIHSFPSQPGPSYQQYASASETNLTLPFNIMASSEDLLSETRVRFIFPALGMDQTNTFVLDEPLTDLFYVYATRGLLLRESFFVGSQEFVYLGSRLAIRAN